MLLEAAVFVLSLPGTPPWALPRVAGAVGLWARGRRHRRGAWASHLARTQSELERLIPDLPRRRAVAVLGSGPLFDVPLQAMAAAFDSVVLVDQVHLLPARLRMRDYPRLRAEWRDLSVEHESAPLAVLDAIPGLDWVISLNLCSQLGVGAAAGAERRVIDAHLDALAALPCPVTLVTDYAYTIRDRRGAIATRFDLLHGRQMPPPAATWDWTVAPFGEEDPGHERVHAVGLWPDWRGATR